MATAVLCNVARPNRWLSGSTSSDNVLIFRMRRGVMEAELDAKDGITSTPSEVYNVDVRGKPKTHPAKETR